MAKETMNDAPPPAKKLNLRVVVMVIGILVVEAVVIIGALKFLGGPAEVPGDTIPPVQAAEDERIVETLVLDDKLFNNKAGSPYLYDTEIYVHVKQKHADKVAQELEQFQNEIKTEIAAIWKTSDPHHFQEPKNESLTRKVYALLNERFGVDQASGDPIVEKCIVYMGTGLRVGG